MCVDTKVVIKRRDLTQVVGNSCESLHVLIVLIKQCVSLSTNGGTQLSGKLAPWNVNDNTN